MKPKHQRLLLIIICLLMGAGAVTLILQNFRDNLVFFYSPSEFYDQAIPAGKKIRIGGMVKEGSAVKDPGTLKLTFTLTDFERDIPVRYEGILPGLFREGQGMVAYGAMASDGIFTAEELLAKHDENYMPPEVAKALKKQEEQK